MTCKTCEDLDRRIDIADSKNDWRTVAKLSKELEQHKADAHSHNSSSDEEE